ncbi:MAG TPA: CHAD domain-containing protein [Acidobacteriaceae bacterium]|jgi:CHAD domain-containing protein
MARADQSAHPLKTLREYTTALEASILVCLAKPEKKAVHKLRTSTRRIEAQLELLSLLPELPPHEKQQRRVRRILRKIRRAAGQVRDLDVQRDLVADEVAGRNGGARPTPALRQEASQLRSDLKRRRDAHAEELMNLLRKHRSKLPLLFEKFFDALKPAGLVTLTEAQLIALVDQWYIRHASPVSPSTLESRDQLHDIRKRAKLARYLAESAPRSATAAHLLAARFEDLQQAGGKWHDWLLIHELAAKELGQAAKLPQRFCIHAENSLGAFKRRLARSSTPGKPAKAA